jgi:hypothetical protein
MERVVYILGAGFSEPLGIPLTSNFLRKSKDMPSSCERFGNIFKAIDRMSNSKTYYSTDVLNIEEVLSILEMNQRIHGEREDLKHSVIDYIKDVIRHYTPDLKPYEGEWETDDRRNLWCGNIFGPFERSPSWYSFGRFVSSIQSLTFEPKESDDGRIFGLRCIRDPEPRTHYSIITLNYDLIFENVCRFINEHYDVDGELSFITKVEERSRDPYKPVLAKLHGSIDSTLIPPTWSKELADPQIQDAWKLAHETLINANYLRIVGYSLPVSDAYVRYFLKSAAIDAFNLKNIDVICLDPDGSVRQKYDDFITFKNYRFINANVVDYLSANDRAIYERRKRNVKPCEKMDQLEVVHEGFVSELILRQDSM